MYRIMRGALPCLEISAACIQQLQEKAVANSPLLREIDTRVQEANERIEQAKSQNRRSVQLSVLSPGLQAILGSGGTSGTSGQGNNNNSIWSRLGSLFSGGSVFTEVIRAIGVPLLQGITNTNQEAQRNSILIGDIQVKIAQLQRDRAQLADTIRERVIVLVLKFDEARTRFQEARANAKIAENAYSVYRLTYIQGNSDTQSYLNERRQFNNIKLLVYREWTGVRRSLLDLKLVVLAIKDAEI